MDELKDEALEIVALGQCCRIEDAPCQVLWGNAGEGVSGARVAASGEEAWILFAESLDVSDKTERCREF